MLETLTVQNDLSDATSTENLKNCLDDHEMIVDLKQLSRERPNRCRSNRRFSHQINLVSTDIQTIEE